MTEVLVAFICCPRCGAEFEGTWVAPAEREDEVEPAVQLCPEWGHVFTADYPRYSFRTEAG